MLILHLQRLNETLLLPFCVFRGTKFHAKLAKHAKKFWPFRVLRVKKQ